MIIFLLQTPLFINGQIINGGFEETVEMDSIDFPSNWVIYGFENHITTDAYTGNYAMFLNSWYQGNALSAFYNGNQLPPSIGVFQRNKELSGMGTPIDISPTKLNGFYKFENVKSNDSLVISIILKKYIETEDSIAIIGKGEKLLPPTINGFTLFEVAINKLSEEDPDSILLSFKTSNNFNLCDDFSSFCNDLTIDDLTLDFTSGIVEQNPIEGLNIFPNPTNDKLTMESLEMKINSFEIFDSNGKKIMSKKIGGTNKHSISVAHLPSSIYYLRVRSEDKMSTKLFVKK